AQDDQGSCLAQMSATVRPLLEQASQFSPQGVRGQGFAPLAQPFAPPTYGSLTGYYPAAPGLPPPTAAYNASAGYTGLAGLPPPGGPALGPPVGPFAPPPGQGLNSAAIAQFLQAGGQLNLTNPQAANPSLLIALANLQQTEQARQQQQALLQQQQGLYLNSLYQLSASYQTTALDWQEAYSTLAQAWLSYYRDLCGSGGSARG
ncbi:MAG TPA: hypothetical protein VFE37_28720, partial [Chloroflexota bacterium]|nr:hypothetical protein [Chloroflexota bacterium]